MTDLIKLIQELPKAELHLHIEGSLEPELMFKLAEKNQIPLDFKSVEEVKAAYQFSNLQTFLDIYYAGAAVLINQSDFYDLTWAYLLNAKEDNIKHVEIFFDPQTHTARGVEFATVVNGIYSALEQGQKDLGISFQLIMCFLRHLSEEDAFKTLEESLKFKDKIVGVGLDSSEVGNPPSKFEKVFKAAKEQGYRLVAHAGEEGPPEYITEALDLLNAERIDHGVRCSESQQLVKRLCAEQIPLTVCPLSNVKLRVFDQLSDHNLKDLLGKNLLVTINSDDPAYFGGYLNQNFLEGAEALDLSQGEIAQLCKNSFTASWLTPEEVLSYHQKIDRIVASEQ